MPDPDVAPARPGDWSRRDSSVEDIALIVEVADSSADRDLSDKLARYARARVAEYWVVDLEHDLIHVFRHSNGKEYSSHERAGIDAVLAPAEYPDVRIEVAPVVGAS